MPADDDVYEIEVLEGELVPQFKGELEPVGPERLPSRAAQPAVQTAVAAATGFVAGAATMALLRRYGPARVERAAPAPAPEPQRIGQVRTYVVHVRNLG
jgi:hypothetical protein